MLIKAFVAGCVVCVCGFSVMAAATVISWRLAVTAGGWMFMLGGATMIIAAALEVALARSGSYRGANQWRGFKHRLRSMMVALRGL